MARDTRTVMSRVPRNIGEKAEGGELSVYLREESDLLTACISPQLRKVRQNVFHLARITILFKLCMLAEEKVKQQLQGIIKEIGLKDEVKKHLRFKLAERLQKSQDLPQFKISSDVLRHRIISSVIKEHLEKIGCTYSSSVFAAESECDQKMLERVELVELLNLPSAHEALSLLEYLIEKSPGRSTLVRNVQIQTEQKDGSLSLEQKFTIMDLEFRRALQQKNNNAVTPKGHDCNEQKKWYEKELFKFKQFEAHMIKLKVGEEWRKKFQSYAEELQNDFRRRIDKLRNKEKTLTEEMATKEKNYLEKTRNWESSAKSRLDLIQMKEGSIVREKANLEAERKRVLDEGKQALEEAKEKGREHEKLLLNLQKRVDYEVGVMKLSLEQAQNQKEQEFANRRKFVDQEYGKLMGIKDTMDLLKDENERLVKENVVLREECKKLREEVRVALGEVSEKADRIDSLRDELTDVKNEKKDLQINIGEEKKLRSKREAEVVEARKQLQSMRARLADQSSESEIDVRGIHQNNDIQLKLMNLREQRRKDIEKFKLES